MEFEDNNSGKVRYCTANDECFVLRNDTIFLKKFDETLAYYAFDNLEGYIMNTFHPDDDHHYVSLKKRETNVTSIYQLRLDTMVNIIAPNNTFESFEIYPNPATNLVNLTLPSYQNYKINILQLNGKTVGTYTFTGNQLQLADLSLPIGTYLLKAAAQNNKPYFAKLLWLGN